MRDRETSAVMPAPPSTPVRTPHEGSREAVMGWQDAPPLVRTPHEGSRVRTARACLRCGLVFELPMRDRETPQTARLAEMFRFELPMRDREPAYCLCRVVRIKHVRTPHEGSRAVVGDRNEVHWIEFELPMRDREPGPARLCRQPPRVRTPHEGSRVTPPRPAWRAQRGFELPMRDRETTGTASYLPFPRRV